MGHGYKCIRAVAQGAPLDDESEYDPPAPVADARRSGGQGRQPSTAQSRSDNVPALKAGGR